VAGVAGAADIAVIPVRSCRRPPCRVRDGLADCQRRAPTAGGPPVPPRARGSLPVCSSWPLR